MPKPHRRTAVSLRSLLAMAFLAGCGGDATTPPEPVEGLGPEEFVLVPPGTFQMGSATSPYPGEKPVHAVTITRAFYLLKTEVTQAQWRTVMGSNPSCFSQCGDTCPVECVSYEDVQAFLEQLNAMEPGKQYRLPTEAEWEYAARAGTTGNWGGTGVLEDMGWWAGNSGERTQPVGRKPANAWGLYDMHGNVWEWVQDWFGFTYYAESPASDPAGPATGQFRSMRGGSWKSGTSDTRVACRFNGWPHDKGSTLGFRIARTK